MKRERDVSANEDARCSSGLWVNVEHQHSASISQCWNEKKSTHETLRLSSALLPWCIIVVFALTVRARAEARLDRSTTVKKKCFRMKFFHLQVSVSFRLSISWVVFFLDFAHKENCWFRIHPIHRFEVLWEKKRVKEKRVKTSKRNFLLTKKKRRHPAKHTRHEIKRKSLKTYWIISDLAKERKSK